MPEFATQSNAVARVAAHFDGLIERYGGDHRALDYGSRLAQRLRFDVLTTGLQLQGRRLLDVGCGMADFKGYLDERGIATTYTGVDASSRMIALARQRYPGARLDVADFLAHETGSVCDVAVANGIFYLLGGQAHELIRAIVTKMWTLASQAVAFTTLSTWAPQMQDGEYHADPVDVLAFCRTLTSRVTLRHDYLPHDFAVFMYKGDVRE